ncbi:TlpA family protein disulfide reductase [Saccharicrinis aurantiacus]|uniref:TlpA family protein disulfide reductase n=1 Tax=Saccharicrinis aurantiacus TaxID=1849719 RepID=UPI00094FF869|nr:redoxin domain-containing protein [Saccharicrinis aurantiacus]
MQTKWHQFILFIIVSFTVISCNEVVTTETPLLHGIVQNHQNRIIKLYNNTIKPELIDSFQIAIDGTFSIEKGLIKDPGFYFLQVDSANHINLFLEPSDYIELRFNTEDVAKTVTSINSSLHNELWSIEYNEKLFAEDIDLVTKELHNQVGKIQNDSILKRIENKKDSVIKVYRSKTEKILDNSNSLITKYWALQQKHGNISLYTLEDDLLLFFENAEELISVPYLKPIFDKYDKDILQIYALKQAKERYSAGAKYPKIKAQTYWDDPFDINDINGKLIHIVLWDYKNSASINKLEEIRTLMRTYGYSGLKTLMIAYNTDKEAWNNEVKKLNIPYYHLINQNGTKANELRNMGVRSLPQNFLVTDKGIIILCDKWGTELNITVKEYLNKQVQ